MNQKQKKLTMRFIAGLLCVVLIDEIFIHARRESLTAFVIAVFVMSVVYFVFMREANER